MRGAGNAEMVPQVVVDDAQRLDNAVDRERGRTRPCSGRCVVASATRSGARRRVPASIITTRGVCVRSARYSVWPVNGTPASLMVLFCSGAVTIASNVPASAPSIAPSSRPST